MSRVVYWRDAPRLINDADNNEHSSDEAGVYTERNTVSFTPHATRVSTRRGSPLKLVRLDASWEPTFWRHVLRDVPNYYFFIADWKLDKDKTEIFLVIREDHVVGSMLMFNRRNVHIRGSPESAALLLSEIDLETAEFTVLKEHESAVLRNYTPVTRREMMVMILERGEEHLHIQHPVVQLGSADAEEIAGLLGEAFPEWEDHTADRILDRMKKGVLLLGIKDDGAVVSLGGARILDFGTNVGVMATRKGYRGRGYATSILSVLIEKILRASKLVLIHVLRDNPSAIRVYTKVGFFPYNTYVSIRGERIAEKEQGTVMNRRSGHGE